ncbi:MAG: amidohydrolase family protein [Alphaproteobacteria bacterium]|nr:amidohydrolase family protein [Alphaproteobacteria bacterium]
MRIDHGRIAAVGTSLDAGALPVVDLGGRTIVPAFVDSHVHLTYAPAGPALADHGIAAAVDLGAPLDRLPPSDGPKVLVAGPLLTAPGGYPTRSWGRDGYGLEVADAAGGAAAVDRVIDAGAVVVKVALDGEPSLSDAALAAIVARAHERKRPVVAHALGEASAARAAAAGVDGLAHTPVEPLSDTTVRAWSKGFVVSTLGAFGGGPATVANLKALRAAGCEVLYGTDFGNTRTAGIDGRELSLLAEAGLDGAAVLDAATARPAARWGLSALGALEVGRAASFLVLDADPLEVPSTLATPGEVWLDGARR